MPPRYRGGNLIRMGGGIFLYSPYNPNSPYSPPLRFYRSPIATVVHRLDRNRTALTKNLTVNLTNVTLLQVVVNGGVNANAAVR